MVQNLKQTLQEMLTKWTKTENYRDRALEMQRTESTSNNNGSQAKWEVDQSKVGCGIFSLLEKNGRITDSTTKPCLR